MFCWKHALLDYCFREIKYLPEYVKENVDSPEQTILEATFCFTAPVTAQGLDLSDLYDHLEVKIQLGRAAEETFLP